MSLIEEEQIAYLESQIDKKDARIKELEAELSDANFMRGIAEKGMGGTLDAEEKLEKEIQSLKDQLDRAKESILKNRQAVTMDSILNNIFDDLSEILKELEGGRNG